MKVRLNILIGLRAITLFWIFKHNPPSFCCLCCKTKLCVCSHTCMFLQVSVWMHTAISSGMVLLYTVVSPLSSQTTCVGVNSVRNCSVWIKMQQQNISVLYPPFIKKKIKQVHFSHINVSHMFWFPSRTLMIHKLLPGTSAAFWFGE